MIGKFALAGSFAIIYNYTAELFPTVVRSTAVGIGGMCARLSGAITPLLILLVIYNLFLYFINSVLKKKIILIKKKMFLLGFFRQNFAGVDICIDSNYFRNIISFITGNG